MTEIREFKPTTKGFPDFFCAMGLGCQKVAHNLAAGKLHKAETAFVTLGEN